MNDNLPLNRVPTEHMLSLELYQENGAGWSAMRQSLAVPDVIALNRFSRSQFGKFPLSSFIHATEPSA